jgi:hypothetical protein
MLADDEHGAYERSHLLKGWMIVVIVAIVASAAVGITALVTRNSTSSIPTTTTKAPTTHTTVPPTTSVAPTTTVPVTTTTSASLANFVGTWSMHDGGLVIAASGTGTISVPGLMYAGCSQTAQIQVSPASATTALVTISGIEAPSCSGVPTSFNPVGGGGANENLTSGSTFTITIAPPGVQTSLGIKYCDQVHAAQEVCGA